MGIKYVRNKTRTSDSNLHPGPRTSRCFSATADPQSQSPHRATGEKRRFSVHVGTFTNAIRCNGFCERRPRVSQVFLRVGAFVAALKPGPEVSLDAFNSQYLQRHSSSAPTMLIPAKVSHVWDAPSEEVENLLFTTLTDGIQLGLNSRGSFASESPC